jgi:hypothetical protein
MQAVASLQPAPQTHKGRESSHSHAPVTSLLVARRLLNRVQHQVLYEPVEQFADPEFVLRGAGDLVDPAELAVVDAATPGATPR